VREATGFSPTAAINHWPYAIATHARNHPDTLHFQEDVFQVEPWKAARGRTVDLLVGSPSCTHFSVAKGKAPKDAGIRSQAEIFIKWAKDIKPTIIILENVREFLSYGPIDEEGHPIKAEAGTCFKAWVQALEAQGYQVAWKLLRACDFGAPTSRLRLFVVARRDGKPIRFPEPSHGIGKLPYRTAADCIDFSLPCPSIFSRKRPLAEPTLARIAEGIKKYVIESAAPFLLYDGRAAFLTKYYSEGGTAQPCTEPLGTITCKARFGLVTVQIAGEPYAIADIGLRMLDPHELARAQGFPDSYRMEGSKKDQIAAIGNSVVPQVMAALVRSNVGAP
jgi:DNA (cytosine-5)-methyltransferase 1